MRSTRFILTAFIALLSFATHNGWAGLRQERTASATPSQQQDGISKTEAVDVAKRRYGGEVVKVEELNRAGRTIYRIRLHLDGGRIKIVEVDAVNGEII